MLQANSVKDVLGFVECYGKYEEVYCRGQSAAYRCVNAGIARNEGHRANEYLICEDAIGANEPGFARLRPIERLAIIQHHSWPTRLIDLTIDPLVALFFAVDNVERKCGGRLYVYAQSGKAVDCKEVRLLSLLPWLTDRSIEAVRMAYEKEYGEPVSDVEVVDLAAETVFLKYSEDLRKLTPRLYDQKGTFAICGNEVRDRQIGQGLRSLDMIRPTVVIEIPYEHKLAIKLELDRCHGINKAKVYSRDLDKTGDHVRDKYRSLDASVKGKYRVMEIRDVSYWGATRVKVIVQLTEVLRIDQIRGIAVVLMEQYRKTNDVVWLYVARDNDDYVMQNWMLEGQWIARNLGEWSPSPIGPLDADGYRWRIEKEYLPLAEFYDKYVLEEDLELFVCHQKVYEKVRAAFRELHEAFGRGSSIKFSTAVQKNKKSLSDAFLKFGDFGHSRNKELDDFLDTYSQAAMPLDSISLWVGKEGVSDRRRHDAIRTCLEEASKCIRVIDRECKVWASRLGVREADFRRIDPYNLPKREYKYVPTMPISPDAVVVEFKVEVGKESDNGLRVWGQTNLFDRATLVVDVRDAQGRLVAHRESEVMKGRFEIAQISQGSLRPEDRPYRVEIMSLLASLQPKEFLEKAGTEYENLTGPNVERIGLGPTIRLKADIAI